MTITATPTELALTSGFPQLAEQLRALGAATLGLDPVYAFIGAAFAGDVTAARATPPRVIQAARRARPGLIVWAAGQERSRPWSFSSRSAGTPAGLSTWATPSCCRCSTGE